MEIWRNFNDLNINRVIFKKVYISTILLLYFIYILKLNSFVYSIEETTQILNETKYDLNNSTESNNLNNYNKTLKDFDDESDEEQVFNNSTKHSTFYNNTNQNFLKKSENSTLSRTNHTIEEEIEIIKSKLMNATFKLDDFYAKTVFDKLFEMFEPASDKVLNFLEINNNLTRIIDTSKSNFNIADSYGVLAYLWFYGIPNKKGKLEFPYGWPRNIDIALRYALKGATKFNCGFCYTMMGMLFAWGYPPLINNTHGWIGIENSTSKMDVLKSSNSKNTYFLYHNPYKYSNNMNSDIINLPLEKNGFDLVSMNYALGSKNKDIFGQLANSYYLRYSLSDITYQYDEVMNSSAFSLHRIPRNLTSIVGISPSSSSRCIVALEPLIFVASKTLGDNRDVFLPEISTLLRENKPKEHETKHYAEWVKSLAADRDPEGMTSLGELYYYGHEAGGIARDVNRAAQLWEESARRGDPQGALARAFLNLDGTIGTERDSGPYLRQVARNGEPSAAALAKYYIYKLGLDVDKNSTIAGEYLKLAADLGDGNAQLIIAHAYAGGKMGVIPPGGQNDTLALKYYKLSAEGGRTVAYFNSAVLTLKGSDTKYKTEESRCIISTDYLTHVVKKNNHVKLLSLLSRRSYEYGDIVGSLLREMTLSEMGFIEGHINSQDLWKEKSIIYYNNEIKKILNNINNNNTIPLSVPIPTFILSSSSSVSNNNNNKNEEINLMEIIFKSNTCKVELLDESNENYSTLYPSKFDMLMSGISSLSFCLVKGNRREVFYQVPISFDNSLIHLNSSYFKYYDMFNSQNATLRGKLDINYSRNMSEKEKNRVSEFLNCWMRPKSYYDNLQGFGRKTKKMNEWGEKEDKEEEDIDEEEFNIFDRLLDLWQRPKSGSYKKYPKPWYKSLNKILKMIKYIYNSVFHKLMIKNNNNNNNNTQMKDVGSNSNIFSRINSYLDQDLEIDEEKVPEIIQLKRNSSLWCSHYYTRRSSSNGDILSTQNLVQQFLEGSFGVNKDPISAFKFIMQGVNNRDPKSILDYAVALNKGIGVKIDKPKSYRLLWHLIARGPFNIEDILPKIPSGPKFIPTILDTIRESIVPLMKNNTNSSIGLRNKLNSNGTRIVDLNRNRNSGLKEFKNSKNLNNTNFDVNNVVQEQVLDQDQDQEQDQDLDIDQYQEEQEQEQEQEQSNNLGGQTKYRKGRRARMNDIINMNIKTQQDLATRVSSFSILMILTLDWIYFNIILRYYYSSLHMKDQIWSFISNSYQNNDNLTTNDEKIESQVNITSLTKNSNILNNEENFENKNHFKDLNKNSDTCFYNTCNIDGKIKSEIYCNYLIEKSCEYTKDTHKNSLEFDKSENNLKKNDKILEEEHFLTLEDDPFPLLSKFRYISDEEYGKASNFWKASISIRLYYFILRVVTIIGIISILIPLSIAITEKLNH